MILFTDNSKYITINQKKQWTPNYKEEDYGFN